MKVTVESKKGLKTNLKIFVEKKIIEGKISERLLELSKTVNLKGFRPGKVPPDVLKRQFGQAVYGEVLEKILKETSSQAIEDRKIKIAGQPKVDLKSYGEGKDLNYNLEVDELPSIKLKNLDNIKFTSYEIKVSDEEINKRINEIAKGQNNFRDKKENNVAEKGNLIVFDYEASINGKSFEGNKGKNTQIVLGKDLFIKGFDKQLLGVKKNQEKNITVNLPENYPNKEYVNKEAIFSCKILNIKIPEPIKIDDEFAKNLGAKDLKDLEELVNKQIQTQYTMSLDALSKESIMDQIEKEHDLDLPENMVNQELQIISQNLKKEDREKNKKESEKVAKKRIKLGLILNEIGENNNLKVSEEELKNEINKQIQSMPGQQKQVLEYYKNNPSAAVSLRGAIYEEKVINLIKTKSTQTKKTISSIEADKILKNDFNNKKHSQPPTKKDEVKKPKKTVKSTKKNKKIRKK
jgi:trigger factor